MTTIENYDERQDELKVRAEEGDEAVVQCSECDTWMDSDTDRVWLCGDAPRCEECGPCRHAECNYEG